MKTAANHPPTTTSPLLASLCALLALSDAPAAIPLRWTVETTRAQPAQWEAYAGETLDFEAAFNAAGKPLEIGGDARLYWQTNGMESAYWSAPATVTGNVMRATWTPALDVGARVYNCFIGVPGSVYHAAFQLRLRPSPGAVPNELPLPQRTLDFSTVTVLNPPWPTNLVNAVDSVNGRTGAVALGAADVGARDVEDLRIYNFKPRPGSSTCQATPLVIEDYDTFAGTLTTNRLTFAGMMPGPTLGNLTRVSYTNDVYTVRVTYNMGQFSSCSAVINETGEDVFSCNDIKAQPMKFQWTKEDGMYTSVHQATMYFSDGLIATSNMVESVVADSVGPLASRVTAAENTVAAWEHYWDGDDVRFTVTNYFGSAADPALYIEQKMPADDDHGTNWFKTVWDERTRLSPITNRLAQAEAGIAALAVAKADNGTWGYYDSHAGTVAPEGFVSISSGGVILGNGQTWQKTLVAEGCEVWTLVGSATIAPGTDGGLRLEDTDGTTVFEVVKGGRVTRGATAAAIVAGDAVTITYTLSDAAANPTIQYCTNLVTHEWQELSTDTTVYPHVVWSNVETTYTATITLPTPRPGKMFFKASYEAGEDGYVKFNSPVDATPGLYVRQGNTRVKIVPVLSGTASGSAVTWKVE